MGYGVVEGFDGDREKGKGDCLVLEWDSKVDMGTGAGMEKEKEREAGKSLSVLRVAELVEMARRGRGGGKEIEGGRGGEATTEWNAEILQRGLLRTSFGAYMNDEAHLLRSLESLSAYGITFLEGVPTKEKEGVDAPALRKVVEKVGVIRRTWYGDLWDVRAKEGSSNIAYTDLDLGLHMDLTCVLSTLSLASFSR